MAQRATTGLNQGGEGGDYARQQLFENMVKDDALRRNVQMFNPNAFQGFGLYQNRKQSDMFGI